MSEVPAPKALRVSARVIGTLLLFVVMVATMPTILPMQVRAAINPKIIISDLSLTPSSITGKEDPTKTAVQSGGYLRLKFSQGASRAQAKGRDSFEVALPEQARNEDKITEPVAFNHDDVSTRVGECSMAERKITCTFNSELDRTVTQGFKNLRSNGMSLVVANGTSDSSNLSIKANDMDTPVAAPGDKIGACVEGPYKSEKVTKWASDLTTDSDEIAWQLIFGPDQIKAVLGEDSQSLTVDGKTRSTVMFINKLDPGRKYVVDKSRWRLEIGTSEGRGASSGQFMDASGADRSTNADDFDLDAAFSGDIAFIKVTGPFVPCGSYIIHYESTPDTDNGKVQPGVRHKNDVIALGVNLQGSYAVHYISSFSINVEMKPGLGEFEITKLLTETQTGKVLVDTTFKVDVNYDLLGDAKASTYPGWKASDTLNQEDIGDDLEMTLNIGAKTVFRKIFPTGAIPTFNEDPTNALVIPRGVIWGRPAFMVNGQSTNIATAKEQMLGVVMLSDSADAVPMDHGDFTIMRALAGDGNFSNSIFLFTYSYTDNITGFLTVKDRKISEHSEGVQAGSTCAVTEITDPAFRAGYTLAAPEPQTVVIIKDQTAEMTMTNTYTKAKDLFSVTNTVKDAEVGGKGFTFTYTCSNGQEGTFKTRANSTPVDGPELFVGMECIIEQNANTAQVDGYFLKALTSQKMHIGKKALDLKFAGTYTFLAMPSPTLSAEAITRSFAEPSAMPSAASAEKLAADTSADPDAKLSTEASAKPSAEANADPADKPATDASADPNAKPSVDVNTDLNARPSADTNVNPNAKPSADANADPSAKPSADASADPINKPIADASVDPNAKPSAGASADPSVRPSADTSADPANKSVADASADPNAEPNADTNSSTTAGNSPSGAVQQVTPTNLVAPVPTDGVPDGPVGGPLASTGVRVGLPLGITVVTMMGGALLMNRRRA